MTDGFYVRRFDELSTDELYAIVQARCEIFVLELGMRCRDFDGRDRDAYHVFCVHGGTLVSYMRALCDGSALTLGRVLTVTHGIGLGRELMEEGLRRLSQLFKFDTVVLHSQKHAVGFYRALGFVCCGEEYIEEGVPHVTMQRCGAIDL